MSRLGKNPLKIPQGVTVTQNGNLITVKGPKGELKRDFRPLIKIEIEGSEIKLTPQNQEKEAMALWGTYASHLDNMMTGVVTPFEKKLQVEGVGYKWSVVGNNVELALGFSHPVKKAIPNGLTVTAEKNNLLISGIDKELVGSFAAGIRSLKKPEPYKGKGIRYEGEFIRRKQGKKSA